MPFCNKCGAEAPQNIKFCPKCGNAQQNEQIPNQGSNAVGNTGIENPSLWEYFLKCLKNYVNFKGRARRKEYWGFVLFYSIIFLALFFAGVFIGDILGDEEGIFGMVLSYLWVFATILPALAVCIRRLHDTGRSGWYILMGLIPIIGGFVVLYFVLVEGKATENQYGPPTKTKYV